MKNKTGWLLLIAVLLTACASFGVRVPQTPEGVRQYWNAHPDGEGVRIDRFEVSRPLNKVAQYIKLKADACFNVRVDTSSATGYNNATVNNHHNYTPYVTVTDKAAEAYVTLSYPGFSSPEIIMVILVDLHPVTNNKHKTKVEMYYSSWKLSTSVAKAFKSWSAGEDIGCPTLD